MNLNKAITQTNSFPVTGMSCASCASSVQTILENTPGVEAVSVNFATEIANITYDESLTADDLNKAVEGAGYGLVIATPEKAETAAADVQESALALAKKRAIGATMFTLPIFTIGMFFMDWELGRWISMLLAIPVLTYFGGHFFKGAWTQLKHKRANMDTLVALSTGLAFVFSLFNTLYPEFWMSKGFMPHVYYEAATVIISFVSIGKLLEARAKQGTNTAIRKLMGMLPDEVLVVENGQEIRVPLKAVEPGQILRIRPGEHIPVDGMVCDGESYVEESMISGEPIPVHKQKGDNLFSGTLNQNGSILMQAEAVGQQTYLAQIVQRVKQAQGSKAPVQKLVDQIAAIFVPIVLGIALITFIVWLAVGGETGFNHALMNAMSVLVIACPCALGLATPTAIMVGLGVGAEHHILIKDAESLEQARNIEVVVLDKTGTITKGCPQVSNLEWSEDADRDVLIPVLLSLEKRSAHPLAIAVAAHFEGQGLVEMNSFESVTGCGVQGSITNGEVYYVGKPSWIISKRLAFPSNLKQNLDKWQEEAKTVILMASSQEVLCVVAITDPIADTAPSAIHAIKQLGIEVHLLTGDQEKTALQVAKTVGISNVKAQVMPDEKRRYIEALQAQGRVVAMVGDGINDAEALATSDVSIAMGHGSDVAMDTAKVTLISSDLNAVPRAIVLSKRTVAGIRQNLFWAFIYNILGIPIAAGLLYPINGFLLDPMIAGGAMALSSVSVVLNSLRLRTMKL